MKKIAIFRYLTDSVQLLIKYSVLLCLIFFITACGNKNTVQKETVTDAKEIKNGEEIVEKKSNVKYLDDQVVTKNTYQKLRKLTPSSGLFKVNLPENWEVEYETKSGLLTAKNPDSKSIELLRVIYRVGGQKHDGLFQNEDFSFNINEFAQSQLDMFGRSRIKFNIIENDDFTNTSVGNDGSLLYSVDASKNNPETFSKFIMKTNGFDAVQFSYTITKEFKPEQLEMLQEIADAFEFGDNIKHAKKPQ